MSLRTIASFQLGKRDAIEAVARSRGSFFTGVILVLLTAIPRNYDQTYILESPFWLFGPLLFSFFSGSFLFWILYSGFIRRHLEAPETVSRATQWRSFMSLFWMTAPVAWLYAIPVERFLNSYPAGEANLALLCIVSLWRILLMARIVSVLQKIRFVRALGWVLIPACLEIIFIVFFGGTLSSQIMAGMSGMLNSPESALLLSAMGNVFVAALILLPIVLTILIVRRFAGTVRPFPVASNDSFPAWQLALLIFIWAAIAVPAQREQRRFVTHARLIELGQYRQSLEYLGRYTRKDFPASRRIEPDPYHYEAWERLPSVMAVLRPNHPEWVRRVYLDHMEALFSHRWLACPPGSLLEMFSALERLPEGKEWIERNRTKLSKLRMAMETRSSRESDTKTTQTLIDLTNVLQRLGVDPKALGEPGTF